MERSPISGRTGWSQVCWPSKPPRSGTSSSPSRSAAGSYLRGLTRRPPAVETGTAGPSPTRGPCLRDRSGHTGKRVPTGPLPRGSGNHQGSTSLRRQAARLSIPVDRLETVTVSAARRGGQEGPPSYRMGAEDGSTAARSHGPECQPAGSGLDGVRQQDKRG